VQGKNFWEVTVWGNKHTQNMICKLLTDKNKNVFVLVYIGKVPSPSIKKNKKGDTIL
jgi:hypothetical protein